MHEINQSSLQDIDRLLAQNPPSRMRAVESERIERKPWSEFGPVVSAADLQRSACTGDCVQGRLCDCVTVTHINTARMSPAECCTEIGADVPQSEPVPWLTRARFWPCYVLLLGAALLGVHGWRAGWLA